VGWVMFSLFLLAQQPTIDYCAYRVPVVVCVKYQVRHRNASSQYFVQQTNGSSEMQINRCSYLAARVEREFRYVPEQKVCPNER